MPLPTSLQKALSKKGAPSQGPDSGMTIAIANGKSNPANGRGTFDRTPAQAAAYNGSPSAFPKGKK